MSRPSSPLFLLIPSFAHSVVSLLIPIVRPFRRRRCPLAHSMNSLFARFFPRFGAILRVVKCLGASIHSLGRFSAESKRSVLSDLHNIPIALSRVLHGSSSFQPSIISCFLSNCPSTLPRGALHSFVLQPDQSYFGRLDLY